MEHFPPDSEAGSKQGLFFPSEMEDFCQMAPGLFCILNDGCFKKTSKTWEEVLGYRSEEIYNRHVKEFIHPDDLENTPAATASTTNAGEHRVFINRYRAKNGTYKWLEWKEKKGSDGITDYVVARDISHEIFLKSQLEEQISIHKAITSSAQDAIIMLDHEGKVLFWNKAATSMLGYTQEEVLGMDLHEMMTPLRFIADHKRAFPVFQSTGTGAVINKTRELSATHKDGHEIPMELSLSAVRLSDKWCSVGIIRDISERKEAEKALRESEARFRSLFENSPVGFYRTTPEGKVILANTAVIKMLGYHSYDEMVNTNFDSDNFMPEYSRDKFRQRIETDGEIKGLESVWTNRLGVNLFVRENAKVVRDENGDSLYYEGTIEDITDTKLAEDALRKSEEKYRILAENISDVISVFNVHLNKFTYFSPSIYKLSGFSAEEVMNQSIDIILDPIDVKAIHASVLAAIRKSEKIEFIQDELYFEVLLGCRGGNRIWVGITLTLQLSANKEIELFGVTRNIDERKKAQLSLIHYAEELQMTNAMKDKLFSIISHDLRGPVGSLKAGLDMLINEDVRDVLSKNNLLLELRHSSTATYDLLENLLNWSRSQADNISLSPDVFNIKQLLIKNVELTAGIANRKSIQVYIKSDDFINVLADKETISLVIRNLLSNAIKFTPNNGTVLVAVHERGEMVEVTVKDTGIGMDKQKINNLFNPSASTTTYGTNHEKGTGIGLILCKDFIEKNGGDIHIESNIGNGSKFIFTIPKA